MRTRSRRWRGRRLMAGVAVLAVTLAGCVTAGTGSNTAPEPRHGGKSERPLMPKEPTKPVTITFSSWVGGSALMKKFAEQFHKEHPKITVQFQNVPAERSSDKLTTQIAGGTAPDTAFVDSSAVLDFSSRGALVNLDRYIAGSKAISTGDYVPGFRSSAIYRGGMYGLPFDGETTGLFYRTDMFRAAGITRPPATWADLRADAAKLTDPAKKQYGFILFAPESEYYWEPFLWQAGGHLMSDDGKRVTFNSPQGQRAARFYVGLRKYSPSDYFNSNSWDGRVAFAAGKVAMYVAGAWFGGEMKSSFPKIKGKWDVAPLPKGPAGCATTIAGDSLVIFNQSKNIDAAWLWLEFLSRAENMKKWTYGSPTSTLLPPRKSLLSDPALGKYNPWLQGFADQMSCAVQDNLTNPKWSQISNDLNTELGKAIYGDESADAALAKAAQKGRQVLRGNG